MRTILVLTTFLYSSSGLELNSCENLLDYVLPTTEHCWHNPDLYKSPGQIARNHNYSLESHQTITEDGYILTLFRLKSKVENAPVIFLQHGILATCETWIAIGNKSLGRFPENLSAAGYDVWLGNFRGTIYSSAHVSPHLSEMEYWDFTFYELGYYDLEAMLGYIAAKTNKPIIYIGHSLGTSAAFIYGIYRKDYVQAYICLAPIALSKNPSDVYLRLRQIIFLGTDLLRIAGYNHFGISTNFYEFVFKKICGGSVTINICNTIVYIALTALESMIAAQYIPIVALIPGTALPLALHMEKQSMIDGNFRFYDYNPVKNIEKYGSLIPPLFDLQQIDRPVYLVYGSEDRLADEKDTILLYELLDTKKYLKKLDGFNHLDFTYGSEPERLQSEILSILDEFKER